MRLEDMLKDISGITNQVVKTNCFEGQNTLLDSILLIQTKVNEVIQAINDGIIKGDKGDKGDTGETGAKGDKGDTGKASESIQDDVISLDTTWSSTKIDSLFKNIEDSEGVKYSTEDNFYTINGSKNGVISDIKLEGKTLVVDSNNQVVLPGTVGATLKSFGDDVSEIKLNSINKNIITSKFEIGGLAWATGDEFSANDRIRSNDFINISGGFDVILSHNLATSVVFRLLEYDANKNFIKVSDLNAVRTTDINTRFIKIGTYGDQSITPSFNFDNLKVQLEIGNTKTNYVDNKINSKKVLFKDTDGTWKKPTLRQWDSIEKHSDGKYYYHKRSGLKIYNGTEVWGITSIAPGSDDNQLLFYIVGITDGKRAGGCLSDKFIRQGSPYFYNGECFIAVHNDGSSYVRINKNKLITQDVQGFKTWLQTNNLNMAYELTQEQVFECTPLDLISYGTQTNYNIECGSIYPKSSLIVKSNYGNVLSNLINRMTQIENDFIEDRKAILRGDFKVLAEKSYPSDFIKEEEITNE